MKVKIIIFVNILFFLTNLNINIFAQETINVSTLLVQPSTLIKKVQKVGISEPLHSVGLVPEIEGVIEKLNYEEQDKVKKGDILANIASQKLKIERDRLQNLLNQAKFIYEKQKANYEMFLSKENIDNSELLSVLDIPVSGKQNIQAQTIAQNVKQAEIQLSISKTNYEKELKIYNQELDIKNSLTNIQQTDLTRKLAKNNYDRNKQLLEKNVITKAQFEQIELDYNLSVLQYEVAQLNHSNLLLNRDAVLLQYQKQYENDKSRYILSRLEQLNVEINSDVELENALFSFNNIQQQYNAVDYNYTKSFIRSPINGIISKKNYEISENANKNTPIYRVVDISEIIINFGITESEIQYFKTGSTALVKFDALPRESFEGAIDKVTVEANDANKTYGVEIKINNPNELIKPGMTARIEYDIIKLEEQILLPLNAIIESTDGSFVYTVQDNLAVKTPVKIGIYVDGKIQILEGLDLGSRVVVKGQQFLTQGSLVNDI